jgi:DNA-binding Lrp family transcriptional regulator
MPIRAYVLVSTDPGKAKDVATEASTIAPSSPRVSASHSVMGRYDVVVQIDATNTDSITDIAKLVLSKISAIKGVRRTETLLVA